MCSQRSRAEAPCGVRSLKFNSYIGLQARELFWKKEKFLLTESAEVAWSESIALSGCESGTRIRISAHRVLFGEKFCSYFGVALCHEVFVHKTSALASIARNVLLSDFMSRTADPVDCVPASIAINFSIDVFGSWQR